MEVKQFRYITVEDNVDTDFVNWSRIYEYPLVLETIHKYFKGLPTPTIHNTAWGWEGDHITFRDKLNEIGVCTHTDVRGPVYYNIAEPWEGKLFDIVINISTLEELSIEKQEVAFKNLYKQVKKGGLLLITADMPGLNLEKIVDKHCLKEGVLINGNNSVIKNSEYGHLNVIFLCIRKV
tara:strand:- start:2505 stop:3041 length:537 start_codon:yes stop_codon:yes gene_type:complete